MWLDEDTSHGFLLDRRGYSSIDVPGSTFTSAYSINAEGLIVGEYLDADDNEHGYVRLPGHGAGAGH